MTEAVTLAQLKVQVKVEEDDASEDGLLQGMLAAAIRTIENRTGRTFADGEFVIADADGPAARMAVLLLGAHWYRNRETVVVGTISSELPMSVEYLITPIAKLSV